MGRLVITGPDEQTQVFEIAAPTINIGRVESNDLVLNHPSVSRHHTQLVSGSESPDVLKDLGSTNGTFVNEVQVQEHQLADQDQIGIGVFKLTYEAATGRPVHVEAVKPDPELTSLLSQGTLDAVLHPETQELAVPEGTPETRLQELEHENKLLKLVMGVGKTLSTALTSEEAIRKAMELAFRMENVERGYVMLLDKDGKGFKPAVMLYKDPSLKSRSRGVSLSENLVTRVMSERLPLLVVDVATDQRFTNSESLRISGVRSAMCAPLIYGEKIFGLFYVDCVTKTFAFSREELNIFGVIATEAAMGFENARAHDELSRRAAERKALERFLSEAVIERIQANPDRVHLGGESQVVTVLFADVRGFTHMSEKMEPAQVVEFLNEYFSEMTEIIFDGGGMLDKYIGDGLMALFGPPIPRRDDVARAVKTAIEMQWALRDLNREWESKGRKKLDVGIGVNTGPVITGNIGSSKRMDYTVIGDAVNLSSRLCSKARGGQILVSESTFNAMGRGFASNKLEPIQVKGKVDPVVVYEILWEQFFLPSTSAAI